LREQDKQGELNDSDVRVLVIKLNRSKKAEPPVIKDKITKQTKNKKVITQKVEAIGTKS